MEDNESIELGKSNTLARIRSFLDELGKEVQNDQEHNIIYKLSEMNVILNFNKFCKNYDEHLRVLNKHIEESRWKRYERGDE